MSTDSKKEIRIKARSRKSLNETARNRLISAIRELISSGSLGPGARLPSEQDLQDRFDLNRHHLRIALQELKTYGIVDTRPQSGTYLANLGMKALDCMLTNVENLNEPDFDSLADTRTILEIRAAELAARNASVEDIEQLQKIITELKSEIENGRRGLDEDYVLHLSIARISKSNVLISVISSIVPTCLHFSEGVQPPERNFQRAFDEHVAIVQAIAARDPQTAVAAMRVHMENTYKATSDLMRNVAASTAQ